MILSYLSCQNSVHKIGVYSYSLLTTAPIRTNIQNMLNSSILTRRVASWSGCVPAITGTARLTQSSASGLTRGAVGNRTSTGRCKNWNRRVQNAMSICIWFNFTDILEDKMITVFKSFNRFRKFLEGVTLQHESFSRVLNPTDTSCGYRQFIKSKYSLV